MDKQDELAACIRAAEFDWNHRDPLTRVGKSTAIAAAVRSFMGSDEVVEAAAKAHCDHFGGEGWWETGLLQDTLPEGRKAMRAAIRTALGGDGECDVRR